MQQISMLVVIGSRSYAMHYSVSIGIFDIDPGQPVVARIPILAKHSSIELRRRRTPAAPGCSLGGCGARRYHARIMSTRLGRHQDLNQ